MKYLYPLALLLLLASCQEEEKQKPVDRKKTDWVFYKLEGNVKTVSEKSYEAADSGQKGVTKHEIASNHDTDLTFNERGMLILEKQWVDKTTPFEETKFNGRENMLSKAQYINGKLGIKTDYSRDKKGNISEIIRRNSDNTQLDRTVMIYNGKNLAKKKSFGNQDNPNDRITYIYDRKGNMRGENLYLNTEYVQVKNLYEYDSQNRKIAETRYTKDKVIYKTTYGYAGKNLIKKETTGPDGKIEYVEKSSYDSKGNLLERYTFDGYDQSETKDNYSYDDKGNLTSWTVTRNNQPDIRAIYKFDSHNNMIEAKVSNGKGEAVDTRAYTYEYDTKGNWIKKTVNLNGMPFTVVERKISYFGDDE